MPQLSAGKRARLPDSVFAYVDSKGRRRLPINDEAHTRNALARFGQVAFEDDAARERARKRLLTAARKYGIMPIGFITGQLRAQQSEAAAGRLVIELRGISSIGEVEERLRTVLRDPTLSVLHWSASLDRYVDGQGHEAPLPGPDDGRVVTFLERQGSPMTALVHDPSIARSRDLVKTVTAAVTLAIENEWLRGRVEASATQARRLPAGFVTFLLTDIEDSTALLRRLDDRYAALLEDVRSLLRTAVRGAGGHEVDARADESFSAFDAAPAALEAAMSIQRGMHERAWPDGLAVRVRVGIHSGQPTLTDAGYVGLAVHTAARVCSCAHGGQIMLSGPAHDAIDGAQPAGITFRSLGSYPLRGLPEAQPLFQVEATGLPATFPPPRTGV